MGLWLRLADRLQSSQDETLHALLNNHMEQLKPLKTMELS